MGVKIAVSKQAMNSHYCSLFLENEHEISLSPEKMDLEGHNCKEWTLWKVSRLQKGTNMVISVPRCQYLAEKNVQNVEVLTQNPVFRCKTPFLLSKSGF